MKTQDLEATEKNLNISITKIFNWPQTSPVNSFNLVFYSQVEQSPIIKKSVTGNYSGNCMNLNAYLKITYTSEQSKIILKIYEQIRNTQQGAFQIDLQQLNNKGVLYYPFGKQYVLQVNKYDPKLNESYLEDRLSNNYQHSLSRGSFYRQDRNQSSRMINTSPLNFQRQSKNNYSKKQFEAKALALMQEVRELKNSNGLASRLSGLYQHRSPSSKIQTLSKCLSQKNLSKLSNGNNKQNSQKHKLILETLDIVPYSYPNNKINSQQYVH